MDGEEAMLRLVVSAILVIGLMAVLAACGGEDPTPTGTTAPLPTAMPELTAMPAPTERPADTPVPTAAAPAAVVATAIPEPTPIPPTPTPEPATTATPPPATEEELLAQYAAEHAGGPGTIFAGHPANPASFAQLIGPPVHEGLVFLQNGRRTAGAVPATLPRSLAGKPLAGFCATRGRRIQDLYGMVVHVIRCNTHYAIDNRR